MHAEQVASGLGEDLGQSDRALEAAGRARVLAPRTLEEHEPFERVGVDAGLLGGALDGRPPEVGALGARHHAAGRERVQQVAAAGRGTAGELAGPRRVPRERVGERLGVLSGLAGRGGNERHAGPRRVVAGEHSGDGSDQHNEGGSDNDESAHPS